MRSTVILSWLRLSEGLTGKEIDHWSVTTQYDPHPRYRAVCGMKSLTQVRTARLLKCTASVPSIHFTTDTRALSLTAVNVNEGILHGGVISAA